MGKAKMMLKLKELADATYNRDLEGEALDMDEDAADIWDKAEVYDAKAEILYSYLQVFGIVVGLALFGYKVIISIGYRLTKLSPSKGFCIQLSTTLVVVTASYIGLPVSTTQSTIGGT